jgi:LemA protein
LSTSKILLIAAAVLVGIVVIFGLGISSSYNNLVGLDQNTQAAWAQVQSAYQRRLDLIPNLVETVKGAAKFEQETLTAVAEARSRVGQLTPESLQSTINDPAAMQRFEQAQAGLGSALQRLMVVVEKYPELKATQAFRDLSVTLEQTENRIGVERKHYNDAAREFNTRRERFPTVIIASLFGDKFRTKTYFTAETGAEKAPQVQF